MSVIKDLLLLDRDQGKPDIFVKYLLKQLHKVQKAEEEKKKKDKKGWTFEDRVCLGLLLAFIAPPLALFYRWLILAH
jgi:hypothetical protein